MSISEADVERAILWRLFWLVGVPLGSSLVPWVFLLGPDVNHVVSWAIVATPLLGAVLALGYGNFVRARTGPLVPYALSAGLMLALLISLVNDTDGDDLANLIYAFYLGIFQPLLALAGGLASYLWVRRQ